jgi:hypothetical protein
MKNSHLLLLGSVAALTALPGSDTISSSASPGSVTLTPIALRVPQQHHSAVPHIRNRNGTSSNWGGYASETSLSSPSKGAVNAVQGSWTIPTVQASSSSTTYSSFWVGIDGYSDGTVEQIGTEQDWTSSGQQNYVWFEMYPHFAYSISGLPISPGDQFAAWVKYGGGSSFVLTISNLTQKVGYTVPSSYTRMKNAQRSSAEWIVEAPYSGGVLPLADFGTAEFTGCSATLYANTGPINSSHWQNDAITMETSGGVVKAQPSAVSGTTSSSFTVQWSHE